MNSFNFMSFTNITSLLLVALVNSLLSILISQTQLIVTWNSFTGHISVALATE